MDLFFVILSNLLKYPKYLQNFFQKQTSGSANFAEIFRALILGYSNAVNILLLGLFCHKGETTAVIFMIHPII